jgi:hypothetical protein
MTSPRRRRWLTGGTVDPTGTVLRVAGCPQPGCLSPAEVYAEVDLSSTDGPLTMARTCCLHRHVFLLPVDYIPGYVADEPGSVADEPGYVADEVAD